MRRYEVRFRDGSTQVYEAKRLMFPEGLADLQHDIPEGVVVLNVTEITAVRVLDDDKPAAPKPADKPAAAPVKP